MAPQVGLATRLNDLQPHAQRPRSNLRLLQHVPLQAFALGAWMPKDSEPTDPRHGVLKLFQTLADELWAQAGQPCDIAARPRETGDQPARNRIAGTCEDDWNGLGRLLRGLRGGCWRGHDDLNLERDQFCREHRKPVEASFGSGSLYTVEHFRAIDERLAEGGMFCQWLPLHQLDLVTLRSIVRAFVEVHPQAWAVLATNSLETPVLGLIARRGGGRFDAVALPRAPARFGLHDEWAVLGSFIAGPQALTRLAGDAPINTDDHPVVTYLAPRMTYASDSRPVEGLIELLHTLDIAPDEVLSADADSATRLRLASYWRSRDRFIEVGQHVQPTPNARRMLAQVRDPLLKVLRLSPDFRPYDPLLRLSAALAESDPAAARLLLTDLMQVQPARPEAAGSGRKRPRR